MQIQIIDSHVHFWQPTTLHYPWLNEFPSINRAFLPEHLAAEASGTALSGLVFVQAGEMDEALQEVQWITALADNAPIKAIVALAPLETGSAVEPLLEQFTTYPLVKGIRRLIQSESAGFTARPDFVSGVRLLNKYKLSFDLCIRHYQLSETIVFVRQCPDVMFVLDHIGKPDIAGGGFEPWCGQLQTLAKADNVYIKLSGLVTEADHANWTCDDLKPYIDHVIDSFGINRVMFGSDWPVCTLAASYTQWLECVLSATDYLTPSEQQQLFFENARQFYRLV